MKVMVITDVCFFHSLLPPSLSLYLCLSHSHCVCVICDSVCGAWWVWCVVCDAWCVWCVWCVVCGAWCVWCVWFGYKFKHRTQWRIHTVHRKSAFSLSCTCCSSMIRGGWHGRLSC